MADFYCKVLVIAGIEFIAGVAAAYYLGRRNGTKNGYARGFIAARLKFEIPRNSRGQFVKKG